MHIVFILSTNMYVSLNVRSIGKRETHFYKTFLTTVLMYVIYNLICSFYGLWVQKIDLSVLKLLNMYMSVSKKDRIMPQSPKCSLLLSPYCFLLLSPFTTQMPVNAPTNCCIKSLDYTVYCIQVYSLVILVVWWSTLLMQLHDCMFMVSKRIWSLWTTLLLHKLWCYIHCTHTCIRSEHLCYCYPPKMYTVHHTTVIYKSSM